MSTAVIIVIVVVVVIALIAVFVALPRMRERARIRGRERRLDARRDQVVTSHREEAAQRERRAEVAEQRARVAEHEAERERAAAQAREEQATLHERGLADDELISDDERDDFAGTSAVPEDGATGDRGMDAAGGRPAEAGTPVDGRAAERPRSR
jgi:FtsZ-interacting cell division protein ZipA